MRFYPAEFNIYLHAFLSLVSIMQSGTGLWIILPKSTVTTTQEVH